MVKCTTTFLLELQNTWVFLVWLENVFKVSNNQKYLIIYFWVYLLINFDNFDILACDANKLTFLIKESLFIFVRFIPNHFRWNYFIETFVDRMASWHCTKKWSFPLRISTLSVTKSAVYCGFGYIYWRILNGKLHFLCTVNRHVIMEILKLVKGVFEKDI